ncbi:MAG: SigB/SigF/SigG family RNA polymerase sigma factor [Pseudonocardiaceae bacterium]|nr:SigB/SigF/SigG family RNA polymerase sigma factor [Pseudonocardiaceae bacterium]
MSDQHSTDTSAPHGSRRGETTDYSHLMPLFRDFAGLGESGHRRAALRQKLVEGHLPVAKHIARRFAQRGEPLDDLEQVATVGLINAIDRFDPHRGVDFLSYAVPTVTGEVRRHFRDLGWGMRVPRRLKDLHVTLGAASSSLSQKLGRAPTATELAKHLQLPKEEVVEGLAAANAYRGTSLDRLTDEDGWGSIADIVGQADHQLEQVEYRESLKPMLSRLPERERTILMLRFFGNMTQTQIADRIGISQMHVSRLLSQTLASLRDGLGRE